VAVAVGEMGVFERYGVEVIGASLPVIKKGEDRELFRAAMENIGLRVPASRIARSMEEARQAAGEIGYPLIIRPSFTLGGTGGGVVYNREDLEKMARAGLDASMIGTIMLEESVLGWKEFELEVMRDHMDNVVIICSIENFDPMGIHTGDSITVAPAQTLTDREYQAMRDASIAVIREIGVETGGSNIQFAINPDNGEMVIIEMNPRVSRSSALASKATGFPIAKIAAKLAVGYTLDEIPNDITLKTQACFEPTLDYVVVKIPKWNFEKFPATIPHLGTQMKSVGEIMAIGRTFQEALGKGLRSLETGKTLSEEEIDLERIHENLMQPNPSRLAYIRAAFLEGDTVDDVHELTGIDRWFLDRFHEMVKLEKDLETVQLEPSSTDLIRLSKRAGISDSRLAQIINETRQQKIGSAARENSLFGKLLKPEDIRDFRIRQGILPVFKRVDTCAAEFESYTPYLYSTYESVDESEPSDGRKIVILGSGPNRIGQGIEFDYCCCHAAFALKKAGYESIMVNCNPETVSTDYDTSDRLYFEPLTFEDVMAIVDQERPEGVIVQFGGQTPLKLSTQLFRAGVPIIGTSPESIDLAEDRKRFGSLLNELGILQPEHGTASSIDGAREIALRIGYPVLVRPSYVLGGRAMAQIYDESGLEKYVASAVQVAPEHPILIDRFLEEAREYDVDALADGQNVVIGGVMEHIEEAGIHSGDSASVLPPVEVSPTHLETMRDYTRRLARALQVVGLMNVQFAIVGDNVYVLEVNPRASRTVPYVSKAIGVPLAQVAVRLMIGEKLPNIGLTSDLEARHFFIKAPVFPFAKFPGVDTILGPEMKSTGEVMGASDDFGEAYGKAQLSAGVVLPRTGVVFISVNERDKKYVARVARSFQDLGFQLLATKGTALAIQEAGLSVDQVFKVNEGRPNVVDRIISDTIDLVVNTPLGRESFFDEKAIRRACIQHNIPCITTLSAAAAAVSAIQAMQRQTISVRSLQEYHQEHPVKIR
jgi:carbamoyl-phosphate synthase large subunit